MISLLFQVISFCPIILAHSGGERRRLERHETVSALHHDLQSRDR